LFHRILPGPGLEGAAGLSTLEPEIAEMHRRTGWGCEELEVEVVTLTSVLEAHARPGFDLLKIDVEGSEAAVLASADLRQWRPRVMV
jgi:FkbM family methyltransferase